MVTFRPGTTPEEMAKIWASLEKLQQLGKDFATLADTIESDNPSRDAWKAVNGLDEPAFDESTQEGHELKARIVRMLGRDIDAQEETV